MLASSSGDSDDSDEREDPRKLATTKQWQTLTHRAGRAFDQSPPVRDRAFKFVLSYVSYHALEICPIRPTPSSYYSEYPTQDIAYFNNSYPNCGIFDVVDMTCHDVGPSWISFFQRNGHN